MTPKASAQERVCPACGSKDLSPHCSSGRDVFGAKCHWLTCSCGNTFDPRTGRRFDRKGVWEL